jgi:ANTAR domain-containing protein
MNTKSNRTTAGTNSRRRDEATPANGPAGHGSNGPDEAVARRTATGWRVGDEELPDLTSAMVFADLLAAELPGEEQWPVPGAPASAAATASPPPAAQPGTYAEVVPDPSAEVPEDTEQLKETVAQLERALTVRVRVEQAIGVLAERHRLRPRQAFELLRSASRARGARVSQTAGEVVASTTNPLLRIPEELARQPEVARGRIPRPARRKP